MKKQPRSGGTYSGPMLFLVSNLLVFVLAFLANVLFTHLLHPEAFGTYKYAINFVLVSQPLIGFGITMSCARLLTTREHADADGTIGAGVVTGVALALVVTISLYATHFFLRANAPASGVARTAATLEVVFPFIIVFMLQAVINAVYQGLGEVIKLAFFNLLPYVIILGVGGLFVWLRLPLDAKTAIYIFLGANAVVLLPRLLGTRCRFRQLGPHLRELWRDVKSVGFKIYLSSIFTSSASSVIALIFGARYGYTEYGYYALALSLAGAFRMISSSLGIARFRDSAQRDKMRRSDLWAVLLSSLVVYGGFAVCIQYVFFWFYPRAYVPAVEYLYLLGAAYLALGAGEYFNRFLIAKGRSTAIMVNSLATGGASIVLSLALGHSLGLRGLAIASVAAAVLNLSLYLWSYRRYLRMLDARSTDAANVSPETWETPSR